MLETKNFFKRGDHLVTHTKDEYYHIYVLENENFMGGLKGVVTKVYYTNSDQVNEGVIYDDFDSSLFALVEDPLEALLDLLNTIEKRYENRKRTDC